MDLRSECLVGALLGSGIRISWGWVLVGGVSWEIHGSEFMGRLGFHGGRIVCREMFQVVFVSSSNRDRGGGVSMSGVLLG